MHSCLFIAALWSPAGKGLTSWLLLVMFIVFLILSLVVSWGMWYLIVSFPVLCRLSYFDALCQYQQFFSNVETFSWIELQYNLCKTATLKATKNWFSRQIIAYRLTILIILHWTKPMGYNKSPFLSKIIHVFYNCDPRKKKNVRNQLQQIKS